LDTDKATEKVSTKSRTHGELLGEAKDTSLSRELETEKENAESKWLPLSQLLDTSKYNHLYP